MDDEEHDPKDVTTGLVDRGNELLTGLFSDGSADRSSGDSNASDGTADSVCSDGVTLDRRSLLMAAGVTTVSLAGCAGASRETQVQVQPVSAYAYGGSPIVRQSTSSVDLLVTESEPNDRKREAMVVESGSTIDGSLTENDSDWYAVDLSSDVTAAVQFERTATSGVTAVILYGPDGTLANIRYVATDEPATFTQPVETSGTHYVQVVDTQDSVTEYSLAVGNEETTETTETSTATETVTATETATPTSTATPTTSSDDYGKQGYGEYGYGGISN